MSVHCLEEKNTTKDLIFCYAVMSFVAETLIKDKIKGVLLYTQINLHIGDDWILQVDLGLHILHVISFPLIDILNVLY